MKIILPGQTIGIIGGGQLGRMLAMSAKEMGYKIAILDPSKEACARHFADTFIHADFDNRNGLERLCHISDVVTFEFENIDSDLLAELEKDYHIVQSASLLKTAQHRLLEKEFARSLGIETVDYQYVDGDTTGVQVDGTYLMKTVRFGYDGKGQSRITEASQVQPYTLLERLVPLDKEISVVAYKDRTGIGIVAVVENEHRNNILYRSIVPTTASPEQEAQAIDYTRRILEAADYYGVLTVEFFISQGRVIFNEILPEDYPYDNGVQTSKHLKKVMANIFNDYGSKVTVEVADKLKDLAFEYETIASISTCKDDYPTYPEIADFIAKGDAKTALIQDQFEQGLLTDTERYNLTIANWREIDGEISSFLKQKLSSMDTDIAVMTNSGARGSVSGIKLASAAIGIMVDINNREIELPVKSSYKNGLNTLESFIATRGARQGQVSTALRTADSGYLTRRLVDVAQDVFTTEEDAEDPGFEVFKSETEQTGIEFVQRITGRYTAAPIPGYLENDQLITRDLAEQIAADNDIDSVRIQSVLTTKSVNGIPQKAYGVDMATRKLVEPNQPVGVIAAQSLGELGTQLTLDTKHSSGVAGSGAISRGLPRVEELLEARNPKGQAWIAPVAGLCEVWEDGNHFVVQITPTSGKTERIEISEDRKIMVKDGASVKTGDVIAAKAKGMEPIIAPFDGNAQIVDHAVLITEGGSGPVRVEIPNEAEMLVKSNDTVQAGDRLTTGSLNLQDQLKYKGVEATARYIMNDIMAVYAANGNDVSAKHLEVIVRQMFSRVMIEESGDTNFVAGDITSINAVEEANRECIATGRTPAEYTQLLLGITKVSIWSDSFLSAASFQDTTRVLINAAINGRVDKLHGLKENVIIGRKIPVGTGVRKLDVSEEEIEGNFGDFKIVQDEDF